MYRPADHLLWDFWTVRAGAETHLFYLRAPRDLADPEDRHALSRVGHAVSRDLRNWRDLGVALEPGPPGAWDDRAIWTGSAARLGDGQGGGFAMLYTGSSHREDGKVQRIGLARSDDLGLWRKHPGNPVIEADPRWYLGPNPLHRGETAWRDPYLVRDPSGHGWLAYITAQARWAAPRGSGAVALARSDDLASWRIGPPAASPGWVIHMEIPQLWRHAGRYFLLFSANRDWIAGSAPVAPQTGTFYLTSDRHDGGFDRGGVLTADRTGSLFGLKLLDDPEGRTWALAWRGYQADGSFAGALSDPMPVRFDAAGGLIIN